MATATIKQINFLDTLIAEREVHQIDLNTIQQLRGKMTTREASDWISYVMRQPRKPKEQPTTSPWAAVNDALADVEISFYAVPASYVVAQQIDLYGNDFLFLRVRNYQGKRYISRVSGSPVAPRYSRVDPKTALYLAGLIKGQHEEFAHYWFEYSGRCGRCNATLTDVASREAGLGPDCRKLWGK